MLRPLRSVLFFFFNDPPTTEIYTLSLHDALPICKRAMTWHRANDDTIQVFTAEKSFWGADDYRFQQAIYLRSEEHTSELQSQSNLVCRLLLEKKKKKI